MPTLLQRSDRCRPRALWLQYTPGKRGNTRARRLKGMPTGAPWHRGIALTPALSAGRGRECSPLLARRCCVCRASWRGGSGAWRRWECRHHLFDEDLQPFQVHRTAQNGIEPRGPGLLIAPDAVDDLLRRPDEHALRDEGGIAPAPALHQVLAFSRHFR